MILYSIFGKVNPKVGYVIHLTIGQLLSAIASKAVHLELTFENRKEEMTIGHNYHKYTPT